jgi:hypothetical protein
MVVDVWESADGLNDALGEQRVQEAIERGELPQPQLDIYAVVDHRSL